MPRIASYRVGIASDRGYKLYHKDTRLERVSTYPIGIYAFLFNVFAFNL
jgi:hypothetical protein